MADAVTVQSLIDYYTNLIIIQYHNKPKAQAMIALFIKELLANGIVFDVLNGFDLEDAVGAQLDIIGEYVGIDRFYQAQNLANYFALTNYAEVTSGMYDPLKWGFSNYTTYGTDSSNGTLDYADLVAGNYTLNDDAYRQLIELKIIQNNSNHSNKSIDESVYEFFGNTVIPSDNGNMHMVYFIPPSQTQLIQAAATKQVLPRPMGVGLQYVVQTNPMFAFSSYAADDMPSDTGIIGFSTYANYATITGETLTYSKINRGF